MLLSFIFHVIVHSTSILHWILKFTFPTKVIFLWEDILRFQNLKCKLITLSSCESGIVDSKISDNYIGIGGAFLYSGCTSVVSSLWKVDEFATAILMMKFYQNLSDQPKKGVLFALRNAQNWLKEVTGEELLHWVQQLTSTSHNLTHPTFTVDDLRKGLDYSKVHKTKGSDCEDINWR